MRLSLLCMLSILLSDAEYFVLLEVHTYSLFITYVRLINQEILFAVVE